MPINWNNYPNFSEDEFRCPCGCDQADMNPDFMEKLQRLRTAAGFGFPVNSGFRCEAYEIAIGGRGEHKEGEAADLGLAGEQALIVVSLAPKLGINRIGAKQHGPYEDRFIHVGTIDDPKYPSPWLWTYE